MRRNARWGCACCHTDLSGVKVRFRRVSPVAPRPREGPLTEPTAGAQPWPRERVLMPHNRPCGRAEATARLACSSDGLPGGRAYRASLSSRLTIDGQVRDKTAIPSPVELFQVAVNVPATNPPSASPCADGLLVIAPVTASGVKSRASPTPAARQETPLTTFWYAVVLEANARADGK
jgi:hypothetical protein